MADIASGQRHQSGAGGLGHPASAQLGPTHGNDADDSGTDTDDEGRLIQQAAATAKVRGSEPPSGAPAPLASKPSSSRGPRAAPAGSAAAATLAQSTAGPAAHATMSAAPRPAPRPPVATTARGKAAPKRPAGAITLRTLLDAGFLVPGSKVLYVEYKGLITWADLTEEGTIVCDGQAFESPSAFSIFVKRKLNPERKADDGWKAVKYAGKLLEHFKEQYLRQQLAASGLGSGATVRGATPPALFGGGGMGPSPHSSAHPSPLRQGAGDANGAGADDDGPPSKRQRTDGEADGAPGSGGGAARPGLKIKLKLKPAAPAPARPGPVLPLPAPPVASVPCGSYSKSAAPGSGEAGVQPFRLRVSDMVVIVMDFHAHCSSAEVGGLLAGTFDPAARTLTISRAFPVLELHQAVLGPAAAGAGATLGSGTGAGAGASRPPVAVEFDATDLARVQEVIRNWGLKCVGSYRSHPAYSATPNAFDVLYAARAQAEARTAAGDEACVCAVVSPYDPAASPGGVSSAITWFHIEYDRSRPLPPLPAGGGDGGGDSAAAAAAATPPAGLQPMALEVEMAENPTSHMDIMSLVSTQFHHTARTYAGRPTRAPMGLPWRPAGTARRPQQTCLEKLVASVVSRLPEMFEGDLRVTYGNMVRDMVQHEFERAGQQRAGGRGSEDGGSGAGGGAGSEGGGFGFGGGGSLAAERSRRAPRSNGVLAAAARFNSDDEETEDDDDEVQLDDDEEPAEDHEI